MTTPDTLLSGARAKPAPAEVPVHELIRLRWSPRAFSDHPVSDARLKAIFEAARWAPSAFNEQPWAFVIARRSDGEAFERMLSCLNANNQGWARHAAALVFAAARLEMTSKPGPNKTALYDLGQAVAHIGLQATAEGIAIHQMVGFDADRATEVAAIAPEYRCLTAFALGYPGDPAALPDALRERELAARVRKPVSEFVFGGSWQQSAGL